MSNRRSYSVTLAGLSLVCLAAIPGCTDRTEGTSKAGRGNRTIDPDFHVHIDKDGSVTGEPGQSPYEGTPEPAEKDRPHQNNGSSGG